MCAKFIQVVRRRQTPTVPSHFYVILYFCTQAAKCFLKQLYEESGSIHTLCETKAISTSDRLYLPTYLPTYLSDCLFYLISPLKDFFLPMPTVNSFHLSLWTILLQVSRTSKKKYRTRFSQALGDWQKRWWKQIQMDHHNYKWNTVQSNFAK